MPSLRCLSETGEHQKHGPPPGETARVWTVESNIQLLARTRDSCLDSFEEPGHAE